MVRSLVYILRSHQDWWFPDTIVTYLSSADITIHELAILHSPTYPSSFAPVLDHKRTDYLTACLQACQNWTEYYLSSDLIITTTAASLLFSYCLKTIHKLTILRDSVWNASLAGHSVDVVWLLERCADAAEKSNAKLKKQTGQDSVFSHAARVLRDMVPNRRTIVAQESQVSSEASVESWAPVEPTDLSLLEFSGDFWLNSPFDFWSGYELDRISLTTPVEITFPWGSIISIYVCKKETVVRSVNDRFHVMIVHEWSLAVKA